MNILVINGPNLNLLGTRQQEIYGNDTLEELMMWLQTSPVSTDHSFKFFQSNHEGELIDILQDERHWANGIIIAPMAWARYEYSLKECLNTVSLPIYEVFLTPEYEFEGNKDSSILSSICIQSLCGHPLSIFIDALDLLVNHLSE